MSRANEVPNTDNAIVEAPSQLALSNLVETLDALLFEGARLGGVTAPHSRASIDLHRVPASIFHALPGRPLYAPEGARSVCWKYVATSGRAHICMFCEHGAECPDIPVVEAEG